MTQVVFISGNKPRSGKGCVGKFMKEYLESEGYSVEIMEFKDKLFEISADILNIPVSKFLEYYDRKISDLTYVEGLSIHNHHNYLHTHEWVKDYPMYEVGGEWYSKREWLIHVSESVIKPHTSSTYFGDALINKISGQDFVIITDSGFVDEALPVIEDVDSECCLVVQLFREDGSSVKDSRKMLVPEDFQPHMRPSFSRIDNNSDLTHLKDNTVEVVSKWMNENL